MIAELEPMLFARYLDGLHKQGWKGTSEQLWLGSFAQFAMYVYMTLSLPSLLVTSLNARGRSALRRAWGRP